MAAQYLYVLPAIRADHLEGLERAFQQAFLDSDTARGADIIANRDRTSLSIYHPVSEEVLVARDWYIVELERLDYIAGVG